MSTIAPPFISVYGSVQSWRTVKVDAIDADLCRRINRPIPARDLQENWAGLRQFRQRHPGHLAVQTRLVMDWSDQKQIAYIQRIPALLPDETQLNPPPRPCPLTHQLEARENPTSDVCPDPTRQLNRVQTEFLPAFGDRITSASGIPVRYPLLKQEDEHR